MDIDKSIDEEVVSAITTAVGLCLEQGGPREIIQPPPFIILPQTIAPQTSPWRFVGRSENMENRRLVGMKGLRW